MSRMPRVYGTLGIYHIIIRGTGQQILFESQSDGTVFLRMLKKYAMESRVTIYAYCLMDNHVHLLLQSEQSSLSEFMKRLAGNYATYFNEKYERIGTLFQSRFKSEPVEDERYFLTVLRYIILNPERAGVRRRDNYQWSAYREYFQHASICDTTFAAKVCRSAEGVQHLLNAEMENSEISKPVRKVSDADAKRIIKSLFGVESGVQLQAFEKKKRNDAIARLKDSGLSVRQIERLTGINRNVVQRA